MRHIRSVATFAAAIVLAGALVIDGRVNETHADTASDALALKDYEAAVRGLPAAKRALGETLAEGAALSCQIAAK